MKYDSAYLWLSGAYLFGMVTLWLAQQFTVGWPSLVIIATVGLIPISLASDVIARNARR